MIGNRNLLLYHTEDKFSLALQLHHCGIQHCTPNYRFSITSRPYHIIHFILDGTGTFVDQEGIHALHQGQAFYIPAGSSAYYTASHDTPWKYCWIGIYADNNNPYLKALFPNNHILDIKMKLSKLEQLILSIIAVTDTRIKDLKKYNESDFAGEQFIPISLPSQALEANSRLLHLFARLIETQTENKYEPAETKDYALTAKSFMDDHFSEPIKIQDVADGVKKSLFTNVNKAK